MPRLNLGRRGSRRRPDGAADRGHLEVMRWLCDAGGRRPCACRTRSSASGPPRRAAVSMSVPEFLLDAVQTVSRLRAGASPRGICVLVHHLGRRERAPDSASVRFARGRRFAAGVSGLPAFAAIEAQELYEEGRPMAPHVGYDRTSRLAMIVHHVWLCTDLILEHDRLLAAVGWCRKERHLHHCSRAMGQALQS